MKQEATAATSNNPNVQIVHKKPHHYLITKLLQIKIKSSIRFIILSYANKVSYSERTV